MWIVAASTDWSWLAYLGPFAPAAGFALAAILYLRHELADAQRRVSRIADQRLELAERAIPAVQSATEAIRASAEMIDRHAGKLGEADQCLSECRAALERLRYTMESYPPQHGRPS